jgi:hypothetical protein
MPTYTRSFLHNYQDVPQQTTVLNFVALLPGLLEYSDKFFGHSDSPQHCLVVVAPSFYRPLSSALGSTALLQTQFLYHMTLIHFLNYS